MFKLIRITAIALFVLFSMPFAATAMDEHGHGSPGHGSPGHEKTSEANHRGEMVHDDHGPAHDMHNEHASMASDGSMIIVGNSVSKGVRGMAHLKNVSATMEKMGMLSTHHFMIAFVDEATGKQVESGTVALKITNPDAKVGETIELIGMDGHFGADVVLDMPGEYHFKLGTKLVDGVKRKFHFHQVIE